MLPVCADSFIAKIFDREDRQLIDWSIIGPTSVSLSS